MRSKKMLFLFAVVLLAASGYGALLYVENAVVAAVRSVEKNTVPRISFGNVKFSLLNRQLTLTDVRMSYGDGTQEHSSYEIRTATAIVPLNLLFNTPDAPALLASEYTEHGTTVHLNMGDAKNPHILTQTFDSSRITNLRGNPRRLLELMRSDQSLLETLWDIIAHMAYDSVTSSGIRLNAPARGSIPAMIMNIDQLITGPFRNMEFQHLQQLGWQILMADREIWRLDELSLKNAHLPSLRTMKMMEALQQQQTMNLGRDEANVDALWKELLLGPTPPIDQIVLKGLVVDPKGWDIRLKAFTLDGPFTEPVNTSVRIESLSLPMERLLARFPLQLPGLRRLNFDINAAVHKDVAGLFKEQCAVSLRDVGNLQCAVTAQAAQ